MNKQFFKLVVGGALLGTALFFAPFFILKIIGFFLIFGLIIWLFKGKRHSGHHWGWAHADHIRSMSEQEYEEYKTRSSHGRCGYGKSDSETKN